MTQDLTYLAALVLLPIAPAYLLYRNLPSRATVAGPFKGLNIRLTGAFGGYFLVFLVLGTQIYPRLNPAPHQHELWTVSGFVALPPSSDPTAVRNVDLMIRPPDPRVLDNGRFTVEVLVPIDEQRRASLPTLIITSPQYRSAYIILAEDTAAFAADYRLRTDPHSRTITILDSIHLIPRRQEAVSASGIEHP